MSKIKVPDPTVPNILIYHPQVGAGVQVFGEVVWSMFKDFEAKHHNNLHEIRAQNPGSWYIDEIIKIQPTVIIMNELYHRFMEAAFYYKRMNPHVKVILLNHCYPYLTDFPLTDNYRDADGQDPIVMMNKFFRDGIDHIINLNYKAPNAEWSSELKDKIIERIFCMRDKFDYYSEWESRPGDFFFYSSIVEQKFSPEFIKKFSQTNMTMDVFGNFRRDRTDEYEGYMDSIIQSSNMAYKGYIKEEELVSIINKYKFFIVPREGSEPFMIALGEAIRCGCIPLVVNNRSDPNPTWIDWAKGCYVEYQTIDELLDKMHYYTRMRGDKGWMRNMGAIAKSISEEMKRRTDYGSFKQMLHSLIF